MERFLGRYAPYFFAILRIVAGLMFTMHGTAKIFGWPGDKAPATATASIIGGWIELICGPLIALGLFASWAAFLCSGMMAVAYFWRHAAGASFWPIENRGELAVLYCFLFLFLAAHGPGIWSLGGRRDRAPL
ncbi:MAG TPA: DoxX family protein [Thermoanaerobaculia bacterium]|jgi:putative oxidoreductase